MVWVIPFGGLVGMDDVETTVDHAPTILSRNRSKSVNHRREEQKRTKGIVLPRPPLSSYNSLFDIYETKCCTYFAPADWTETTTHHIIFVIICGHGNGPCKERCLSLSRKLFG
jgi:hypothetical protein